MLNIVFLSKLLLVIVFSPLSSVFAQVSVLETLPFGIKVGITQNKEIEHRGVCTKRIEVSGGYFRCQEYTMAGGKFEISSSQNEIVSSVTFSAYSKHQLPQSWQSLGIILAYGFNESEAFITADDFLTILKKENAKNIKLTQYRHSSDLSFKVITFIFGNHLFNAKFSVNDGPEANCNECGLADITITESY